VVEGAVHARRARSLENRPVRPTPAILNPKSWTQVIGSIVETP
jgi:hypothetical protein